MGIMQRFQTFPIWEVDDSPLIRFNSQSFGGGEDRSCDVPIYSCNLHMLFSAITTLAEGSGP